jgi:hypothetical protein
MLTTTAGRTLRISAPTDGSKETVQISPLRGGRAFTIQIFLPKGLEVGQFRLIAVHSFRQSRRRLLDGIALRRGQLAEFRRRPFFSD